MEQKYEVEVDGIKILISSGDLTIQKVDAIVNPANEWLEHGGGAA